MRHWFPVAFLLAAATIAVLWWSIYQRPTPQSDFNIVLIVIDTLRADRLPFYGSSMNATPFLDGLARRSAVFERSHSPSSWTAPATASIFTSLYPNQHQVWTGFMVAKLVFPDELGRLNRIPDAIPTIPVVLKRLGYRTVGVTDNINVGEPMGFARGFDRFANFRYASADVVNQTIRRWREELIQGGKYFLYLHYMDPHQPYNRHERWFREGAGSDHLARLEQWGRSVEGREVPVMLGNYDSELGYVDSKIRELFELLNWEDNTLLIVTADHGEEFLDHGLNGHHHNRLYSELLHVPLIMFLPERISPQRISDNVSTLDILPTLRELAGGQSDPMDEGVSLLPLLEGRKLEPRAVFAVRKDEGSGEPPPTTRAVIFDRWKYILSLPDKHEELYDIEADSWEQHDTIDTERGVADDLRRRLNEFEATAQVLPRAYGEVRTEEYDTHLRALGYVR